MPNLLSRSIFTFQVPVRQLNNVQIVLMSCYFNGTLNFQS